MLHTFMLFVYVFTGVPLHEQDMVTERLMQEYSCVPVFLDDDLVDKYYNGFRLVQT
jgi:trehalose 6-phosphate synthase